MSIIEVGNSRMNDVAVAVIVFNRPDKTRRLVEILTSVHPKELFVVSDGPREDVVDEDRLVNETRAQFEDLPWDCVVYKNYSDTNLGCQLRVSTGLDWVFANVDRAVILEDDCLPSESFFPYCSDLLERYSDDMNILSITGTRLAPTNRERNNNYSFSKYFSSWGWATWSRAWKMYDRELLGFLEVRDSDFLARTLGGIRPKLYWTWILNGVLRGRFDSWAYRWMFSHWLHGGMCIVPGINLISNIGFDAHATHTKSRDKSLVVESGELRFPLHEPDCIEIDETMDKWLEDSVYSKSIMGRIKWIFR